MRRGDRLTRRVATLAASARRLPGRRTIGAAIGLVCFAAALYVVFSQGDQLDQAARALRTAPPGLIIAALVLPVLNLAVISAAFRVLTVRYTPDGRDPIGHVEMASIITSAWLLNHLPMRPGMVGRFAYHKKVNGIRVADTTRVLIESIVLSASAVLLLAGIAVVFTVRDEHLGTGSTVLVTAAPIAIGTIASAALGLTASPWWRHATAWTLRYTDAVIWVARYAVVFALVGSPLEPDRAVLIAAISQAVLLIPISGNGLGIREWAIGIAAEVGLFADVLNRVAELAVAVTLGLLAAWDVSRRIARTPSGSAASDSRPSPADAETTDPPLPPPVESS